jgi:N-acyl-phosphatidylethanolamine-hydrolysing phospholipase D
MRFLGNRFRNVYAHKPHTLLGVLRWKLGLMKKEGALRPSSRPVPKAPNLHAPAASFSSSTAKERLRLTWIGHSTFLIEHRGHTLLTDPIFGNCGPLPWGGLRRSISPGVKLEHLPPVHDVLISHSHYDHLDAHTIGALHNGIRYWVPQGLCNWFEKRGIGSCQELAWWQSASLSEDLTLHSVPAQHASGRSPFDRDRTHWCGWVLRSFDRSVYFAGDTGYSPLFREIGRRFRGFDLALIPIGAYEPRWLMHPMHLNPAEAVQAHIDVSSKLSIACHWGTFHLTDEPADEPPELLAEALSTRKIEPGNFLVLRPGETIEV